MSLKQWDFAKEVAKREMAILDRLKVEASKDRLANVIAHAMHVAPKKESVRTPVSRG